MIKIIISIGMIAITGYVGLTLFQQAVANFDHTMEVRLNQMIRNER